MSMVRFNPSWLLLPAFFYFLDISVTFIIPFSLPICFLALSNEKNDLLLKNIPAWFFISLIGLFLSNEYRLYISLFGLGGAVLSLIDYIEGEPIYFFSLKFKRASFSQINGKLKLISVLMILGCWFIFNRWFSKPVTILWDSRSIDISSVAFVVSAIAVYISIALITDFFGRLYFREKNLEGESGSISLEQLHPFWQSQAGSSLKQGFKPSESAAAPPAPPKESTDTAPVEEPPVEKKASESQEPFAEKKSSEQEKTEEENRAEKKEAESVKPSDDSAGFVAKGDYAEILNKAWRDLVEQNKTSIFDANLYSEFKELFRLLDEEGNCSSVRQQDSRDKTLDRTQYDILARTSLAEHSVHVAQEVVRMVNEEYGVGKSALLPRLLFAALAHDIGKLLLVSGKEYCTGQHPIDGAAYVRDVLLKNKPKQAENIALLIRRHHDGIMEGRTSKEQAILIRADQAARKMEAADAINKIKQESGTDKELTDQKVEGVMSKFEPKKKTLQAPLDIREIPPHFPMEEVMRKLLPHINHIKKGGYFKVFSQPDGNIYLQAEVVHGVIGQVAIDAGYNDPFYTATDDHTKKSCLQSFCNYWRKQGYVPEKLIYRNFYGNFFLVFNPRTSRPVRTFYMVLKAEAFGFEPKHFEKQRKGHSFAARIRILGVAATAEQEKRLLEKYEKGYFDNSNEKEG